MSFPSENGDVQCYVSLPEAIYDIDYLVVKGGSDKRSDLGLHNHLFPI